MIQKAIRRLYDWLKIHSTAFCFFGAALAMLVGLLFAIYADVEAKLNPTECKGWPDTK